MDLLLCGHHYRASLTALLAAEAAVYDEDDVLVPPGQTLTSADSAMRRLRSAGVCAVLLMRRAARAESACPPIGWPHLAASTGIGPGSWQQAVGRVFGPAWARPPSLPSGSVPS